MTKEMVNHPDHYLGERNPEYEPIVIIEKLNLNFCVGNALKYLSRAGRKNNLYQDYDKALWYLERECTYGNQKHDYAYCLTEKDKDNILQEWKLNDTIGGVVRCILSGFIMDAWRMLHAELNS